MPFDDDSQAVIAREVVNEDPPYPQCHASTLAQTPAGDLVAAWFGGTHERHPDVGIWVARRIEGRWQDAVEVANGVQPDGVRLPTWNPVLFQASAGPLMLFYKVGPSPREWWGMVTSSDDGGRTWDQPRRLPNGVLGPIKNKPVVLEDGTWLCPSSTEETEAGWRVHFERTRDGGATWETSGPVAKGADGLGAIQPSVLFHAAGQLQAISRTRNGVLAATWSEDAGQTWSPLEPLPLPCPNSGTDALTLADGRHLLVYNHSAPPPETPGKGVRWPLDIAISPDGGTWQHVLTLESEPLEHGYAYPAVIQTADGLVHVTYTWGRRRIRHVVLDPALLPDTGLHVTGLRCESADNPLGIDTERPTLSWRLASGERGQRQTGWQVLAASSADLLKRDQADLWDSGRVESGETAHIPYGGVPLSSSQRVFWKVRVWDRDGSPTHCSPVATWTMGVLTEDDWRGQWVCAPGATESLLLRREFAVRPGLRRAVAHVCGLGHYELTFNGAKASTDLLTPGWTAYSRTALYDTRDVTALLHEGANAVGIVLGNGMYNVVRRNRFVKFTGSFGALRAILHLRLEYADGTVEFVGTDDANWRTLAGPLTFNCVYGGEDHDARLEPEDWNLPGFDDRAWPRAVEVVRPDGALRGHSAACEPVRAIETRPPVASQAFLDGSVVYDLGQNASFMPYLRVHGPSGSTVRLTPAEVVHDDGTIDRATMGGAHRGSSWWQYTKATDGAEAWSPKFFYVGCRYLKAECLPPEAGGPAPEIASVAGVVVHSRATPVGHFAASNPLLNRIRSLVRWAQRSNMVSVLTDCPHREKLGWLEQYHLNAPSLRYEFDVARHFAKGMNDMADAQDDGLVPTTAPEFAKFKGTFRAAAEWGAAFFLVPWQQYEWTGDSGLLATHWEAMTRYFAYLESRTDGEGIVSEGLGDWYDLGPAERPGAAQLTPPPVTATAFYYLGASVLARAAALLGRTAEAEDYTARSARIRTDYNRRFFNPEAGVYATGSQCANALPLVMGLAEPEERARVLVALVRDVEARDCATTAGDVGFRYVLQALAEGGRSDVVYRMINGDEKPGYGYQLKQGATSLTEAWDANRRASHNHFMLGQVIEWFYKDLAGIGSDPAGPGFRKILLNPHPVGDLAWVEARYRSVRGPISVRWERDGDRFSLRASVPAGTTATLFLPDDGGDGAHEGGARAERRSGVTFLRREEDRTVYALASGAYGFTSRWRSKETIGR